MYLCECIEQEFLFFLVLLPSSLKRIFKLFSYLIGNIRFFWNEGSTCSIMLFVKKGSKYFWYFKRSLRSHKRRDEFENIFKALDVKNIKNKICWKSLLQNAPQFFFYKWLSNAEDHHKISSNYDHQEKTFFERDLLNYLNYLFQELEDDEMPIESYKKHLIFNDMRRQFDEP